MKVLMLGWELPPHNSGGLGVACYHLCKSLAKKDIDIEFVLPYDSAEDHEFMKVTAAMPYGVKTILKAGIAYDSYKYVYKDGKIEWHDIYSQQAGYEAAVDALSDETDFDIVHAHDWLTFRAAMRLKVKRDVPIVLHVHSVERDRAGGNAGNPMVREIEEMAFHMADHIIAVSGHTKKMIHQDYNIPLENIEVVHNSLEASTIEPLDQDNTYRYLESLRGQGYRIVTNIGRLTIQKGLPNLLRAAQLVVQQRPKTMFLIVGSGEQYVELIELAAELGIGKNVIFTGFLRGKAWRDAFAISDLFVMPSVSEPFGLTPLEAAGYGTPSMVSKTSGVSEILYHALKVDYWDVDEMANQILAVVNNDPLRDQLTEGAQTEVFKMSWSKAADRIFDIYDHHLRRKAVAV
ncbi:glycosyltransferase family 4 protein [Candidatus Saccharibacteria bacterium]|nr:glycosyltransferase family 4 protein [Candidatus Saccharibacteria bacterium]